MRTLARHPLVRPRPSRARRGGVLLEFAVVAIMLYFMLGALITFGHFYFSAHTVQSAAELAARELSQTPLPAAATFADALADADVRARVYDEDFLVINITPWAGGGTGLTLYEWINQTYDPPTVNQLLYPLMFRQRIAGDDYLRYPGALVEKPGSLFGFTVEIPVVLARSATGTETVRWTPVLSEIPSSGDAFPVTGDGIAAVRLLCPHQSVWLSGGFPAFHEVDEAGVASSATNSPSGPLVDPGFLGHPYATESGLGRQYAFGREVRPYRHLITGQAIYRREVFE